MKALTRTRRRKVVLSALTTLLAVAATAGAFYLVFGDGEGSGSAKLGSGSPETLPIKVAFSPGLTPGESEGIVFTANNTTKHAAEVGNLAWTASSSAAGCEPSWFAVSGSGLSGGEAAVSPALMIAPGEEKVIDAGTQLTFMENGVLESACEAGQLTITAHTTP